MILRLVTYFWLAMTLILLLKPGIGHEQNVFFPNEDKVVHFGLFFSLTALWFRHFVRELSFSLRRATIMISFFGFLIGGGTELLQDYIPGRETDIMDFAFNLAGVTVGGVFGFLLEKRNQSLAN